jgi:hypothetical protein
VERRLHSFCDFLFISTMVLCLIHLLELWINNNPDFHWIPPHMPGWLTLLCAFLPALGAAFAGIRSQTEAFRVAQRSRAMVESLTAQQNNLSAVSISPNQLNSQKLRHCADTTSELMIRELLDWRVVFLDRPLVFPI